MAPDTAFTLPAAWNASGRITASGNTAVRIRNPNRSPVYFVVTADDTLPTDTIALAHMIPAFRTDRPRDSEEAITLADTERLWLVSPSGVVDVTVTRGAVV